jgi:hypothetical protein
MYNSASDISPKYQSLAETADGALRVRLLSAQIGPNGFV